THGRGPDCFWSATVQTTQSRFIRADMQNIRDRCKAFLKKFFVCVYPHKTDVMPAPAVLPYTLTRPRGSRRFVGIVRIKRSIGSSDSVAIFGVRVEPARVAIALHVCAYLIDLGISTTRPSFSFSLVACL